MTQKRTRVSNEQILTAISEQTAAITALVSAISGQTVAQQVTAPAVETPAITEWRDIPAASEPEAPAPTPTNKSEALTARYTKSYMDTVTEKAMAHALKHGADVAVYARTNTRNEWKLGYILADRAKALKDKGFKGFIKIVKAS